MVGDHLATIRNEMLTVLLDHAAREDATEGGGDVLAALTAIVERHGAALTPDEARRLMDVSRSAHALTLACRRFDEAHAAGDGARQEALLAEIARLRREARDAATFQNFTLAAEALCRATSFDEFCALLPRVDLDRLHGGGFGKVSRFPLIWAMSARDRPLERVQLMVAAGARVDLTTRLGDTVLHEMAAMNRKAAVRLSILRFLVFRGADVEARNIHGQTPLWIALDRGSAEDVGHFLAVGAAVSETDLKAAMRWPRKLEIVLEHLRDDDAMLRVAGGLGGWLRGEIAGTRNLAEEAVAQGAKGDFHGRWVQDLERSLEMIAALPGYAEAAGGRKVTWTEEPAAFRRVKSAETLQAYREALARVEITTFSMRGDHPIYWPIRAREDRPERLWSMLAAGASVKGAPGNGEALHIFAETRRSDPEEQVALARMLVQAGADLEARTHDGKTPLACAVAGRGHAETAALLRSGADPDIRLRWASLDEGHFRAPLLFAGAEEALIFRLLLDHGADPARRDSRGRSLDTYLREKIARQAADMDRGEMSGNLLRRLKRSTRALSTSLDLLNDRRPVRSRKDRG